MDCSSQASCLPLRVTGDKGAFVPAEFIHDTAQAIPAFPYPGCAILHAVIVQLLVTTRGEEEEDTPAVKGLVNRMPDQAFSRYKFQSFEGPGAYELVPGGHIRRSQEPYLQVAFSGNPCFALDAFPLAISQSFQREDSDSPSEPQPAPLLLVFALSGFPDLVCIPGADGGVNHAG